MPSNHRSHGVSLGALSPGQKVFGERLGPSRDYHSSSHPGKYASSISNREAMSECRALAGVDVGVPEVPMGGGWTRHRRSGVTVLVSALAKFRRPGLQG
ncbi:hypothetical protein VTO73DRAFT_11428 [Trametes versicolor]